MNAVELLQKELPRLEHDVISVGDWQQPAEDRYMLSRRMLEVVRDLGFPLFIVERSPLLTRDLDLLMEINQKTWVGDDERHLDALIRATKDHGGTCVLG